MAHFELALSRDQARRFDKVLDAYVVNELLCRPDVDLDVIAEEQAPGVHRRRVFISSSNHLSALRARWEQRLSERR